MSRFSVQIVLSQSAENFRSVTLLGCVSETFRWRKSLWIRGRGKYQDFLPKNFCPTVPKKVRRETLKGLSDCGYRKMLCFTGLCHVIPSKNFCLTEPKIFAGEPFCATFRKVSGIA